MNKVLLIIQREYLTRVKKRSFVVMTLLVPGLILAMYGIVALIYAKSDDLNIKHIIRVHDESGLFQGKFHDKKNLVFVNADQSIPQSKANFQKNHDDFLLIISGRFPRPDAVQIVSENKPNFNIIDNIKDQMNQIATTNSLVNAGIDTAKLNAIKSDIMVNAKQITDKGVEDSSIDASYATGITGAILIYISLLIYGAQVMRGVIEEKTNRIIEVIVSSVKPFQLMLGKIIGVGMVGLTQFMLWIVLSTGVTIIAGNFFIKNQSPAKTEKMALHRPGIGISAANTAAVPRSPALSFYNSLQTIHYGYILSCFIFYFLTGYLLYSALFAAVGSAVDSETETQQFMFPITLPLLFTYLLSFAFLINNPDSSLAFWLSVIPFTAPVAMMVRIPFGVPDWQLALSAAMMIIGFLFTTWVASRIYRVGILMYGKKSSYKELVKWFFYKE